MNDYLDYLQHHGIKGQKWGVRRFQNPDGTLTARGRIHFSKDDDIDVRSDSNGIRYGQAKTPKQIKSISGDTFAIEGVDIKNDSDRLMFRNFLSNKGIDTKNLSCITILGSDMNKAYGLKGSNAYKKDFHIQVFDGLNIKDPKVSQTLRPMGCRWMEDIVDNNLRRN